MDRPKFYDDRDILIHSRPELLRETVSNAARQLSTMGLVEVQRWEDLRVSGRLIIGEIVQAIDRAQLGAFVLTRLNHNVIELAPVSRTGRLR